VGYHSWGHKELDMTEWLTLHFTLLSLLWILFQVGCLFPLCFFSLISFYLVPLSVPYFFVISFFFFFFFDGWNCIPSLLLFGLRHQAQEFARSWVEMGLRAEMRTSGRAHTDDPCGLSFSVSPVVQTWHSYHRSSGPTPCLGSKALQAVSPTKKKRQQRRKRTIMKNKKIK